ncbi:hypothetical protein LNTAR_15312 [Lentisphaera araneosa HTCC2155]|uniref:PD-(D/E)XK endonuclease-like domain-containing protein n=1 Tax=Lentisphaera araneosa HTCC2155 TaxID=313628 RepID=A6DRI7_9BACT|nr:PD-(D/E)XK nuclease family protein [Lentisphaera araneosa]EDM25797.1 hypothetical protein LNTAR_15312 [Lentisphaera araneosa HTCC2155]
MNTNLDFTALRKAPHWSFSALNSLLNICSLQYALGRVYKEPAEFTPINLTFGKAFHRAASHYLQSIIAGDPADSKELKDTFAHFFQDEVNHSFTEVRFAEGMASDDYILKGQDMLQVLADDFDPEDRVIGTDIAFRVDLKDSMDNVISKPLIGEYDALIERKGCTVIVDFKTAASRWPADKCHKDLQATAYLYALRQESGHAESLFRYDVVTKAKKPTMTKFMTNRTQDDFTRFMELVRVADRIVADQLYYPHETAFACSGCQYKGACAQWQKTCPEQRYFNEGLDHAA